MPLPTPLRPAADAPFFYLLTRLMHPIKNRRFPQAVDPDFNTKG